MKFKKPAPVPENSRLKAIAVGTAEVFKLDPRIIEREPGFNKRYDFGNITILAEDILANGVLEALKVRKEGPHIYLVNGDRRLTAIRTLLDEGLWPEDPANQGFPMPVPCTSEGRAVKPIDRIFMMLSLNTGKPFTMLEKAYAYQDILAQNPKINASEIARRSGETKQAVSNALQLVTHGSERLLTAVRCDEISATAALEIIKSTKDHPEQDAALTAALTTATSKGRNHITPKDIEPKPKKDKPATKEHAPLWEYRYSPDPEWTQGQAFAPTKLRAADSLKHGIAILELTVAKDMGFYVFGYNLQTEKIAHSERPKIESTTHNEEGIAIVAAWKSLGPILGQFARQSADPMATLAYLESLGHELTATFPTGWDHCNSIFADSDSDTPDPTAGAFIADLSDEDEDPENPQSTIHNPQSSPTIPDPKAYQNILNAPTSNRDGSGSGGPGSGYASPDKRLKTIEEAMDTLDRDQCHTDRWDTIELILDYLNGNHTIATIKKHLTSKA
jgi:hypothetical protein